MREAIAHVRDNYPYWNASGGADHFMVFSYDHGKCEMAKALKFEEFGRMFSVQAYGSLVYRWAEICKPPSLPPVTDAGKFLLPTYSSAIA